MKTFNKIQHGLYSRDIPPSTDKDGAVVNDGSGEVFIPSSWIIAEKQRLYEKAIREVSLPWWSRLYSKEKQINLLNEELNRKLCGYGIND